MSWLLWPWSAPADDIQYHYEIIIFEVRHICSQDVGLHFQLDILKREMRETGWCVGGEFMIEPLWHEQKYVKPPPPKKKTNRHILVTTNLPDPCQSVLQLLLHVAVVHHRLIRLCCSVICRHTDRKQTWLRYCTVKLLLFLWNLCIFYLAFISDWNKRINLFQCTYEQWCKTRLNHTNGNKSCYNWWRK